MKRDLSSVIRAPGSHRRSAWLVALIAAALPAAPLTASDPPHWYSSTVVIGCGEQCHTLHNAEGGGLTQAASNVNLCQSCHNPSGPYAAGLPINDGDAAIRGVSGTSHAFDAAAVDVLLETQLPLDPEMVLRVMDGDIVCSTCHDQHAAEAALGGTPRISTPVKVVAAGGTGSLGAGGTFAGTAGLWYLVEIVGAGAETTASFCYSKDNGTSWFPSGCDPPLTLSPNLSADGATPVALDSGVSVTFDAGSFQLGERFEFSASYPFLRSPMTVAGAGSAICRDCHRSWEMDHTAVETWDGGYKSHPVGVALNANGKGYDHAVPLDGDGGSPGSDANPSNDLELDDNGTVQCLTCHGVHYVDSNTLTVDTP